LKDNEHKIKDRNQINLEYKFSSEKCSGVESIAAEENWRKRQRWNHLCYLANIAALQFMHS